jgi:hypothetical protein
MASSLLAVTSAVRSLRGRSSGLLRRGLGIAALGTALFSPLAASAAPWDWGYGRGYGRPTPPPPVPVPSQRWGETAQTYTDYETDPVAAQAALDRRCNVGRLVGGLVGGGVGYAASRDDGRTWAVPLGALLGSQVGCQMGTGRGPTLW